MDPDDDPISFDFANEEILQFAEEASRLEKQMIEDQNRQQMDELKAKLEEEQAVMKQHLEAQEIELAKKMAE